MKTITLLAILGLGALLAAQSTPPPTTPAAQAPAEPTAPAEPALGALALQELQGTATAPAAPAPPTAAFPPHAPTPDPRPRTSAGTRIRLAPPAQAPAARPPRTSVPAPRVPSEARALVERSLAALHADGARAHELTTRARQEAQLQAERAQLDALRAELEGKREALEAQVEGQLDAAEAQFQGLDDQRDALADELEALRDQLVGDDQDPVGRRTQQEHLRQREKALHALEKALHGKQAQIEQARELAELSLHELDAKLAHELGLAEERLDSENPFDEPGVLSLYEAEAAAELSDMPDSLFAPGAPHDGQIGAGPAEGWAPAAMTGQAWPPAEAPAPGPGQKVRGAVRSRIQALGNDGQTLWSYTLPEGSNSGVYRLQIDKCKECDDCEHCQEDGRCQDCEDCGDEQCASESQSGPARVGVWRFDDLHKQLQPLLQWNGEHHKLAQEELKKALETAKVRIAKPRSVKPQGNGQGHVLNLDDGHFAPLLEKQYVELLRKGAGASAGEDCAPDEACTPAPHAGGDSSAAIQELRDLVREMRGDVQGLREELKDLREQVSRLHKPDIR